MEPEGTLPMVLQVTDSAEPLVDMEMVDAADDASMDDDESMDDDDEDVENTNIVKKYEYPVLIFCDLEVN